MKLFVTLSMTSIIIIAALALVVLIIIFILLNLFVFSRMRKKKKVSEIIDKFEYLHSSFLGRDTTNLSRIEYISRTNLIYVTTYQELNRSYHDILGNDDSEMAKTINKLQQELAEKKDDALKTDIVLAKEQLEAYEKKVIFFSQQLLSLLKPEEEAKVKSSVIKQEVRELKQAVDENSSQLSLVLESFDTVFSNINKQFSRFDSLIDYANYEDATNLLPPLQKVVTTLKASVKLLPDLCVQLQTLLPDKISSIKDRYETMIREGYPLYRILNDEDINALENELQTLIQDVKSFKLNDVQERISVMLSRIEDYNLAFEREVEAKDIYEKRSHNAYELETKAEQNLIDLNNALPSVRKIYVLSDEDQSSLDAIGAQVNQAGAIKRKLDSLTSSLSKQPYSSYVDKMNSLEEESQKALEMLSDFSSHLKELKNECISWQDNIAVVYEKAKDCERKLREMNIRKKSEEYGPSFLKLYQKIDESYRCLRNAPINIGVIKKNMEDIANSDSDFLEDISNNYEQMKLADASILLANHSRGDYVQFDSMLRQAETLYYQGDFAQAYQMVSSELARRKSEQ